MRGKIVLLTVLAVLSLGYWAYRARAPKPNIVLISLDTQRPDKLSLYGNTLGLSPNLDELSKLGAVVYRNNYSDSYYTLPSHISIFSGQPLPIHQVDFYHPFRRPDPLKTQFATLTQILKDNGYVTAGFWEAYNDHLYPAFGLHRGFDEIFPNDLKDETEARFISSWLKSISPSKPFFAFIHQNAAHAPYMVADDGHEAPGLGKEIPKTWDDFYAKGFRKKNELFQASIPKVTAAINPNMREFYSAQLDQILYITMNELLFYTIVNDPKTDKKIVTQLYEAASKYSDWLNGIIFEAVKQTRGLDNTIFVIVSDHGEELGERGYFGHFAPYDETARSVFIVISKKLKGTSFVDEYTQGFDVLPTLLDLAGIKFDPASFYGRSQLPGSREIGRDLVFARGHTFKPTQGGAKMVQDQEWKYVLYGNGEEALYKVRNRRPDENVNLAETEPEALEKMKKKFSTVESAWPPAPKP